MIETRCKENRLVNKVDFLVNGLVAVVVHMQPNLMLELRRKKLTSQQLAAQPSWCYARSNMGLGVANSSPFDTIQLWRWWSGNEAVKEKSH